MPSLQILSDLHIEFQASQPVRTDADVVVLAGDIHSGGRTIEWVKQAFPDGPVVLVLGNHDYWDNGTGIDGALDRARAETVGANVYLLENDAVTLAGIRFLGCTLWTDYRLSGNQPLAMVDAQMVINDFKRIKGPGDEELIPADIEHRHQQSRAWLQRELEADHEGPTVVVTHHAPSLLSIPERFRARQNSHRMAAYASSMEHLCGTADLWIHGHIHESVDYDMAGTRIVSNPRGYGPNALNRRFDPVFCVQVNLQPGKVKDA
jgi:predicted phosphodiesterase